MSNANNNLPYGFEISEEYVDAGTPVYYLSYKGEGIGVFYTRIGAEVAAAREAR